MKLFVTLGGRTAEVVVEGDHLTVDGVRCQASLAPVVGTPLYQVIVGDRPLILAARHEGGGRWILQDRGEVVEIEAMDERTRHIAAMVGEGKRQIDAATKRSADELVNASPHPFFDADAWERASIPVETGAKDWQPPRPDPGEATPGEPQQAEPPK